MNPYERPTAAIADTTVDNELAGLGDRFAAALLDGVIMLLVIGPLMFLGGYWQTVMSAAAAGQRPGFGYTLMWAGIGFVALVVVQGVPLAKAGQTWGKKMCRIRIVNLDGETPSLGGILLLRYLPVQIVSTIPAVGVLMTLVDILLIFGRDRRCLHDRIAGTRVIRIG